MDIAVDEAQANLLAAKNNLNSIFDVMACAYEKLSNVAQRISKNIDPNQHSGAINYIGLENIESNTGNIVGKISSNYNEIKSTKNCFIENDVLYGKLRPNLNKVYLAKEAGICSTDIYVFRFKNHELARIYTYVLRSKKFN